MENNGEAKWYVVHTYTGHEKMVEDNLKKMIDLEMRLPSLGFALASVFALTF